MSKKYDKYDTSMRVATIYKILLEEATVDLPYNRQDICDYFDAEYDGEHTPTVKTISKDLKALMEQDLILYTAPSNYDEDGTKTPRSFRGGGYYPTHINLELWELKLILDSLNEIYFLDYDSLQSIIDKLKTHIPEDMLQTLDEIENKLDRNLYSSDKHPRFKNNMDLLTYAIAERKTVSFAYMKRGIRKQETIPDQKERRVFSPYKIGRSGAFFYVIGWRGSKEDGMVATYRIDHIYNLRVHANKKRKSSKRGSMGYMSPREKRLLKCSQNDSYYLPFIDRKSKLKDVMSAEYGSGFFVGEKIESINIKLNDINSVNTLYDLFGYHNIEIYGDSLEHIFIKNAVAPEVYYKILQLGNMIEVISPKKVRDEISRRIAAMHDMYKGD